VAVYPTNERHREATVVDATLHAQAQFILEHCLGGHIPFECHIGLHKLPGVYFKASSCPAAGELPVNVNKLTMGTTVANIPYKVPMEMSGDGRAAAFRCRAGNPA
jgi:hypothetical protein